jgi:hypothetical protein
MVEVHLVRGKRLPTVSARPRSQLPKKFDRAMLSNSHPDRLEFAVSSQ